MSIDHAMTVARLAADFGVSLEEIRDAMRRLDDPVRWMFQSGRAPMSVAVIVAMGRSGSLISTS